MKLLLKIVLLIFIIFILASCGKVAKESIDDSSDDSLPEFVYFTSTSNPRISYVRYGFNLLNEDICIVSSIPIDITGYKINVVSGNSFTFVSTKGSTQLTTANQIILCTGLNNEDYYGGMFGWGLTVSAWTRGQSVIELINSNNVVIQTVQL